MKAFNDDLGVQLKYLSNVRIVNDLNAPEIINGSDLGIPNWLLELQEVMASHLPEAFAKSWPVRFLDAIQVGTNLEDVKAPFTVFILEQNLKSINTLRLNSKDQKELEVLEHAGVITEQMIVSHKYNSSLLQVTRDVAYQLATFAVTKEGCLNHYSVRASKYSYSAAYSVTSVTQAMIIANEARSYLSLDNSGTNEIVEQSEKLLQLISECMKK